MTHNETQMKNMKTTLLFAAMIALGGAGCPGTGRGQAALRTDTAGNPVTSLNLGGGNVTGTLAAERLPAGARSPVVQTITQTSGNVTLGPGTNVAVLGNALTGPLHLTAPAAGSYPAGRALVVIDPGNFSGAATGVSLAPAAGNTLNGGTAALTILSGTGTADLRPDGSTRWTTGQSYLYAPTDQGIVLTGTADGSGTRLLSVQTAAGSEALGVHGDGVVRAQDFVAENAFSSDHGKITSDGEGNLTTVGGVGAEVVSAPVLHLKTVNLGHHIDADSEHAGIYFSVDGKLHCLTPDGSDHTLTWTP